MVDQLLIGTGFCRLLIAAKDNHKESFKTHIRFKLFIRKIFSIILIKNLFKTLRVNIYFGDHNKFATEDGQFFLEADQIIIHENYTSDNLNHDFCLLHTEADIIKSSTMNGGPDIKMACLPEGPSEHGKACWVGGWGATEFGGYSSDVLMSVGINVFENDYCTQHRKI